MYGYESEATGAVVADPEIGLCLFVQEYRDGVDVSAQITKALNYRSELLPTRHTGSERNDENGEWRVALHWMVDSRDLKSWIQQISYLRQETAYFEEVPVDAIINTHNDWMQSIEIHGLPRLLFNLRKVLNKETIDESISWASADPLIEEYIRRIPDAISDELEGLLASEMLSEFERIRSQQSSVQSDLTNPREPLHLELLNIESFRNIERLQIVLGAGANTVSSHVFQGPNGSGKSSIVEALSLSAVGVSNRFLEYIDDPNVPKGAGMRKYVDSYLAPVGDNGTTTPRVSINGADLAAISQPAERDINLLKQRLRSSFLSQLGRTDFLAREASDLGREVAQSFSTVAAELFDYVTRKQADAEKERREFNRSWDINANISRVATAQSRILERILLDSFRPDRSLESWLSSRAIERVPMFQPIAELKQAWSDWKATYKDQLARMGNRESFDGKRFLASIGSEYQNLIDRSRMTLLEFSELLPEIPSNLDEMVRDYAKWLSVTRDAAREVDSKEGAEIVQELDDVTRELNDIQARQASLNGIRSHLTQTSRFLQSDWSKSYENFCPTCATDLEKRGGISKIVSKALKESDAQLGAL